MVGSWVMFGDPFVKDVVTPYTVVTTDSDACCCVA